MKSVRQRDTTAEKSVRTVLRELGASYRVNNRKLPGSPDISNITKGWAIFVNGCFWHGHKNCPKTKGGRSSRIPVTRRVWWSDKIRANRQRDGRKCRALRALGFRVAVVWECQLADPDRFRARLERLLRKERFDEEA